MRMIHLSGKLLNLLVFRTVLSLPFFSGHLSPQFASLYLYLIPIVLALQSLLVTAIPSTKARKYWYADSLTIIGVELSTLLILGFAARNYLLPMTGLLIVVMTFFRSLILIGYIAMLPHQSVSVLRRSVYLSLAICLLLSPLSSWREINRPLMGDEPYYLLIAYSILHDHDIDLVNNYRNGDSLTFTDQRLEPQTFDNWRNGRLMSRHPPMLPVFLLPSFIVFGVRGALFSLILFTALLAAGLYRLLTQFDISDDLSVWISAMTVLTAPMIFYSQVLFTELPAATLAVITVSCVLDLNQRKRYPILLALICTLAATALKTRFALLCFAPLIVSLVLNIKLRRRRWGWFALVGLLLVLIAIINSTYYGSPLGRYVLSELTRLTNWRLFRGLLGTLFDQQYGLLPINPIFVFAIPGMFFLYKSTGLPRFLIWISAWLPTFLLIALYAELTGGICPKGRFLVAWVPFLAVPIAFSLFNLRGFFWRSIISASLIATLLNVFIQQIDPKLQIVYPGSSDGFLSRISGILGMDLIGCIPSFDRVEEGLLRSGLIAFFAIMCLTVLAIRYGVRPCASSEHSLRQRGSLSFIVLVFLSICSLSALCLFPLQSPWMHPEDPVFSTTGSARVFWEEPRNWDDWSIRTASPYRSGIRLHQNDSLLRAIRLRYPISALDSAAALEIIARGSYPGPEMPILEVGVGDHILGHVTVKSNEFESYVVPWPYGALDILPPLRLKHSDSSAGGTYIDIDKIRLRKWEEPWPIMPPKRDDPFPISFGSLTVQTIDLSPEPVQQGYPFSISAKVVFENETPQPDLGLLFISDTRAYITPLQNLRSEEQVDYTITIPPQFGSGIFEVLAQARDPDSGQFIAPEGTHFFRCGKRAWLGRIIVDPGPVVSQDNWIERISAKTAIPANHIIQIDRSWHLSRNSDVAIKLDQEISANGLVLISNISSVFEEIPWDTFIGIIELDSTESNVEYQIQLGKETAEAMYEFGGKEVRLAHPQAPIIERQPKIIHWPVEFEGISYNEVIYYSRLDWGRDLPIREIRVRSLDFPGVWNTYALALVLP
ncbi:hypothetical protein JW823_02410 [bacterium]|nr:hypothetical protein [candidate division CSSED10-310 bacterium]